MNTKITVVTPSFNQARFVEQTLRSVLSQRDQIHEYFVLDGGSADGSADIVRRYAEQGGITYWHSKHDKGQPSAIDDGFKRATGDVICWLNSDDVFLPGALRQVREAFDRHPQWDALTGYHVRMDSDSRIVSMHRIPGEGPTAARWGMHHVAQPACFFRRKSYEAVGGINLELHCCLDTELWFRMFDRNTCWGHIPSYLAGFRVHPQSKGGSWQEAYEREWRLMDQRFPQYHSDTLKHSLGVGVYRLTQILTGRWFREKLDEKRRRGQTLEQVFGPWDTGPIEAVRTV